jgi:hypothetical protein
MSPGESAAGGGERPPAATAAESAERAAQAAPAAPAAPVRESAPPTRPAEAPAASTGTDNKYVVWSSTPGDAPRTGPDDR